jgi:hypothetical protein
LFIVIVRCEKVDEVRKSSGAPPGGMDALTPFHNRARVDAPAGEPALDVIEGDGEIIRMLLKVCGNTPPAAGAVFATEVGIGENHREFMLCARFLVLHRGLGQLLDDVEEVDEVDAAHG